MITKGITQLVAEAEAEIETLSAEEAIALMDDADVELVDIRDIRELWREGAVPGARHVPRGMIEFWIDPDSPYHKPFFASGKKFVFFCAGGMRSALATQAAQNMGLAPSPTSRAASVRGRRPAAPPRRSRVPSSPPRWAGPLAPLLAAYLALPPPTRGMLLLLGATIGFASMHAVIRIASSEQHPFEVAFFRNLFGLVFIAPFLLRHGFGALRTRKLPLHAVRGAVHVSAMLMFFLAVPITPLGTVAALSFTAPLFVTVGAVLLLGEAVRVRRIVALIAGFAGALVIIRPGMAALDPGSLLVLGSSAVWAAALILIKLLSRTESSLTMTAYMAVFLTPLSSIAAAFVWQWPTLEDLGWFALMGSVGTLGHLCLGQAFREADATVVLPVDFLRLIWSSLYGYLLFNEIPVLYVWIGGVVIFASTLYLAYREAKVARATIAAKAGAPPPS